MTKVQFVNAVHYMGKQNYTIETDIVPMPGEGIWFRASSLVKPDNMIDLVYVPERNIASLTIEAPANALEMLAQQAALARQMQQTQAPEEEFEPDVEAYKQDTE